MPNFVSRWVNAAAKAQEGHDDGSSDLSLGKLTILVLSSKGIQNESKRVTQRAAGMVWSQFIP